MQQAHIAHYVTGALVRNLLGSARTSEDFDIVVDMEDRTPEDVRAFLEAAGYTVEGPLKGNLGTRFVIEAGGMETDIWMPPRSEIHRRELANRRAVEWQGHQIPIMDPADYVLRKVVTWKKVRHKSTDLDDAYQVLAIAWDSIDAEGLVERARFHRVHEELRELVELVREDRRAAGVTAEERR